MSKVEMPELPERFRWEVRMRDKRSGYPVYRVTLQYKSRPFGFWDNVLSDDTGGLSDDDLFQTAQSILNSYEYRREGRKREGYYGDN